MAHIVHCRVCKQEMDLKLLIESIEWIQPSKGWYYHTKCYTEWKAAKEQTDDNWILKIYDLLARDLKVKYDYHQCEAQRKKHINNRMTNKGIYYTLYWHFLIKGARWEPKYGLGIIPLIYKEATSYWTTKENATAGILDQIARLDTERSLALPTIVKDRPAKKKKQIKAPLEE